MEQPAYEERSKRRQFNDVTSILHYLDTQQEPHPPSRRRKKTLKMGLIKPFTLAQKALVIYLRFGSVTSDRKVWNSSKEVFMRTGVKPSAQCNIIKRWRKRGFRLESYLNKRGLKRKLTENQRNFIKNPKILKEWAHLSLEQRAAILREKFDLKSLHPSTLWHYYRLEKVSYRKPQFSYAHKERNQRSICEDQEGFSRHLATILMKGRQTRGGVCGRDNIQPVAAAHEMLAETERVAQPANHAWEIPVADWCSE